jgi:hypothetical protein
LLSQLGIYEPAGRDEDGWPHFHQLDQPAPGGLKEQEQLLKECVIRYFEL